jgi:hypothetical protein
MCFRIGQGGFESQVLYLLGFLNLEYWHTHPCLSLSSFVKWVFHFLLTVAWELSGVTDTMALSLNVNWMAGEGHF